MPSAILIHPAVWPQQTWAENWGGRLCPFEGGELGPHLTQCGQGRGLSTRWQDSADMAIGTKQQLDKLQSPSYFCCPPGWPSRLRFTTSASFSTASWPRKTAYRLCVGPASGSYVNSRLVRSSLTSDTAKTLVHAFISSRLDYCNSLLYGVGDGLLKKLQPVQNATARVVTGAKKFDHITPVFRNLHWLPVR